MTEKPGIALRLRMTKYFGSARDVELERRVQALVDDTMAALQCKHPEGRILGVSGQAGAGKTAAVDRAIARNPDLNNGTLVAIDTPFPCGLKQLGRAILHSLDYHVERELTDHLTWEKVRFHLRAREKRFLLLDEMQNALGAGSDYDMMRLCSAFKSLVQCRDWPVSLILVGQPEVQTFINYDEQIRRRSQVLHFPSFTPRNTALIRQTIDALIRDHAGIDMTKEIGAEDFAERLCHAAGGAYGIMIDLTKEAVINAFDRDGAQATVGLQDYAQVYKRKRSSITREENIFLVDEWWGIQPPRARMQELRNGAESSKRKGRR
ncbi:ATP-binding protein [Nitrospirillum viridazoti]|uniref:TniB protein n=1 Tax=Nitrospirillum amazonense TaxID=28077 RepID=A0A560I5K2_9PROT|nr:ATP-binding protein [Nitrospirillum amazonense]TWB54246.1 TniB protein [Nitrospirillum amazonense]